MAPVVSLWGLVALEGGLVALQGGLVALQGSLVALKEGFGGHCGVLMWFGGPTGGTGGYCGVLMGFDGPKGALVSIMVSL